MISSSTRDGPHNVNSRIMSRQCIIRYSLGPWSCCSLIAFHVDLGPPDHGGILRPKVAQVETLMRVPFMAVSIIQVHQLSHNDRRTACVATAILWRTSNKASVILIIRVSVRDHSNMAANLHRYHCSRRPLRQIRVEWYCCERRIRAESS
jgi:hypothetical protein